ncbi:MAG: hypothetical protein NC517_02280 [Firmicutes bacterium]|nr:hypothetical protein [Bacillota bacterium]
MPDVIIRILSIIGIVFLILLCIVLAALLLVLFWPVVYRVQGEKGPEKLTLTAKADWLFGFLRVRYAYPEPGNVVIKLLGKTLVDTGKKASGEKQAAEEGKSPEEKQDTEESKSPEEKQDTGESKSPEEKQAAVEKVRNQEEKSAVENEEQNPEEKSAAEEEQCAEPDRETGKREEGAQPDGTEVENTPFSAVFEKIQKIKYTILKIYDRIKEIWANISYYVALLREEDTALLWAHVKLRVGKILKNIRPRHISANVLFGTGAPDTTGYAFGVYGMLLPILGKNVNVTPDFSRAVLEGNVDVSGHITLSTLAWNTLKLLLDRKLKLFIEKMKAGRKANGR